MTTIREENSYFITIDFKFIVVLSPTLAILPIKYLEECLIDDIRSVDGGRGLQPCLNIYKRFLNSSRYIRDNKQFV